MLTLWPSQIFFGIISLRLNIQNCSKLRCYLGDKLSFIFQNNNYICSSKTLK